MIVSIAGKLYDSTKVPILIVFDENEKALFNGMERYVSTPPEFTRHQREEILSYSICTYENGEISISPEVLIKEECKHINLERTNNKYGYYFICKDCGAEQT